MTLSKSRFAVALECPRQLDYARDPNYYDARTDNEFLASLAEGGHQVGELARRMFPGGHLIDDLSGDTQARRTAEFLGSREVILFEATIRHENLLVRTDILEKKGNQVSLIEVKAKGFDPNEDTLLTDQGRIRCARVGDRICMTWPIKPMCFGQLTLTLRSRPISCCWIRPSP